MIEEKLKRLIQSRYKSIREFAIEIDMPYSTIDSIFKRGLINASISNVLKICSALNISADALGDGEILPVLINDAWHTRLTTAYVKAPQLTQESICKILDIDHVKVPMKAEEVLRETPPPSDYLAYVARGGQSGRIKNTPEIQESLDRDKKKADEMKEEDFPF